MVSSFKYLNISVNNINGFYSSLVPTDPCNPSPCGPNSQCRPVNGQAVCSCVIGYLGLPPSCRPECSVSSDCPQNQACNNQKCVDPCLGVCGIRATCKVVSHNPICSCQQGMTGDPFIACSPIRKLTFVFVSLFTNANPRYVFLI